MLCIIHLQHCSSRVVHFSLASLNEPLSNWLWYYLNALLLLWKLTRLGLYRLISDRETMNAATICKPNVTVEPTLSTTHINNTGDMIFYSLYSQHSCSCEISLSFVGLLGDETKCWSWQRYCSAIFSIIFETFEIWALAFCFPRVTLHW